MKDYNEILKKYPGYYSLGDQFPKYAINKNGELLNLDKEKPHPWHKSLPVKNKNVTGGYRSITVKNLEGKRCRLFRHRILAELFISKPKTDKTLIVNHKNGIPGDDALDNLEWVTYSENLIHALKNNLMPNSVTPVLRKCLSSGDVKRYKSLTDCSNDMDYLESQMRDRCTNRRLVNYPDGYQFKFDDGSEWEAMSDMYSGYLGYKLVAVWDLKTNKTIICDGLRSASVTIGYDSSGLSKKVRAQFTKPLNGRFIVRYVSKDCNWPKFTEKEINDYLKTSEGPDFGNGGEITPLSVGRIPTEEFHFGEYVRVNRG